MGSRPFVIFPFAVLAAGLVFVGCSGGGGGPAATATPTPAATAAPTPTPAATASPTAAALPLDEYLILTLRIDADLNLIDLSFPSLQEDREGFRQVAIELNRAISEISQEALETLSDATPPSEAEAYHAALLDIFQGFPDIFDELAAALESDDSDRITAAVLEFTPLLSDLGKAAEEGQRLAIVALAVDGDDAVNAYLISAAEVKLEGAAVLSDLGADLQNLLASGDIDAGLALIEDLIARLEDLDGQWQELSPPPGAQEFHNRQAELFAQGIAAERRFLTALRDGDEAALLVALEQLLEFSTEGGRLAADWDELLIDALSR